MKIRKGGGGRGMTRISYGHRVRGGVFKGEEREKCLVETMNVLCMSRVTETLLHNVRMCSIVNAPSREAYHSRGSSNVY